MKRKDALKRFKDNLPFSFKDTGLLESVFVHRSFLNEKGGLGLECNERLEFLGDSVLSTIISQVLFKRFPAMDEGELTRIRARLINRRTLAGLSKDLGLGALLLMGKGERRSRGMDNPAILADTFEAFIAAVYLDRGLLTAYRFTEELFTPVIDSFISRPGYFDFKPDLQELTQRLFKEQPAYRVIKEEGPAHKKVFSVEVIVTGKVMGTGRATKKKDAEQLAAREALERLNKPQTIRKRTCRSRT
jgi:ribonuclease III